MEKLPFIKNNKQVKLKECFDNLYLYNTIDTRIKIKYVYNILSYR